MGCVASSGANNLAYFSRAPRIASPLLQAAEPRLPYNASRTYVGFVLGDGDNIAIVKDARMHWMQVRGGGAGEGEGRARDPRRAGAPRKVRERSVAIGVFPAAVDAVGIDAAPDPRLATLVLRGGQHDRARLLYHATNGASCCSSCVVRCCACADMSMRACLRAACVRACVRACA